MKLSDLGEFGFIRKISEKIPKSSDVLLGIGDDTAVTRTTPGMVLLSTADLLAEGVHFRLDWCDPVSLGRKALSVNLSDIAAMGGIPRYAILSIAVPEQTTAEFLERFMEGFLRQAERYSVSLVGGDTSASSAGMFINITLLGEQYPDRVIKRSGARNGDLVCVSGTLGDSALGLQLLKSGTYSPRQIEKHLDPTPRVELAKLLAEQRIPSAMIDISDGLYADLGHILTSSAKGARICVDRIPLSVNFTASVAETNPDYYLLPLSSGEEYELLFTLNPDKLEDAEEVASLAGTSITAIGEITDKNGLFLAFADGRGYDGQVTCYDHFALS